MLAAVQAPEKHSMPDPFFEGNKRSVLEMLFWKGSDSWSTFQRRMLTQVCPVGWEIVSHWHRSTAENDTEKVLPDSKVYVCSTGSKSLPVDTSVPNTCRSIAQSASKALPSFITKYFLLYSLFLCNL